MSDPSQPIVQLSYLDKSYKEARDELLAKAPIVSNGVWTDLNSSELLVALLELVLGVNDLNMFYYDHQTNEAFLDRAKERKNVISHCNDISYRLSSWSPAIGSVVVKLRDPQEGYVFIPKYTLLTSKAGLPYYCTDGSYLTNIIPTISISVAQGLPNVITYTSNGLSDQKYLIPSTFVAEGSITVTLEDVEWECIDDHFVKSGPYSEHYMLALESNNSMYVLFGDGIVGSIPPEGSVITIEWADTVGPAGNVKANQISGFNDQSAFTQLLVISSTIFSGGAQPETIEAAKKLAPMTLRSLWRGVTRDDFVVLTEQFPGVRQASVLDINDYPLYSFSLSYYSVVVVAIPQDGDYLSDQYKLELTQYLEDRKYVTCDIQVSDPEYYLINIEAAIYKYKDYDERSVLANVEKALQDFFKIAQSPVASYRLTGTVDGMVLGGDLRYSVLISTIQSVDGVAYVDLVSPEGDVTINYKQIATLGELKLSISDISDYVIGNYATVKNV